MRYLPDFYTFLVKKEKGQKWCKTTYEDCQVSDHTCVCLGVGELKKKDERRKSEMSKHPNLLCGQFLNSPTNPQRGEKEVIEQDIRIFI